MGIYWYEIEPQKHAFLLDKVIETIAAVLSFANDKHFYLPKEWVHS